MNQNMFKQAFFPPGKTSSPSDYIFDEQDFNQYLLDKYFSQQLLTKIKSAVGATKDLSLLVLYPENSGSWFISIGKEVYPNVLYVVESPRYGSLRGLGVQEKNIQIYGLQNISIIYSSSPFDYIKKDTIVITREDKIRTKKLIEDLYNLGYENTIVSIGAFLDDESLPIHDLKESIISHKNNPSIALFEKDPKYAKKLKRIYMEIPLSIFKINKNKKPYDKKDFIREIDEYYPGYYEYQEKEINQYDILDKKKFPDIFKYLPETDKSVALVVDQIVSPINRETATTLTKWTNSKVPNMKQKTLHHMDNMSPITAIPFSKIVSDVLVYGYAENLGRIYQEESRIKHNNSLVEHSEYKVMEKAVDAYKPDNIDLLFNTKTKLISERKIIKDGDVILLGHQDLDNSPMMDMILDSDLKNIFVIYVNIKGTKPPPPEDFVLIDKITIDNTKFFKDIAEKYPSLGKIIKSSIDKKRDYYRINVDLYVIRPTDGGAEEKSTELNENEEQSAEPGIIEPKFLVLKQDLFEYTDDFMVLGIFAKEIAQQFPMLSPDSVKVTSRAILNKIKTGVVYDEKLEKMISIVFQKINSTTLVVVTNATKTLV